MWKKLKGAHGHSDYSTHFSFPSQCTLFLSKMSSLFATLISSYPTWAALSTYLKSAEGGALRIYDNSTPDAPFALIRYVKGQSDLSIPHVRMMRSVVWDTMANRPVSVTPAKSVEGEAIPYVTAVEQLRAEHFVDGTLIGLFYDKYSSQWRIHTRSVLGAQSRYFSQTTTFATMFEQAVKAARIEFDSLDKNSCYSWVLQHPENRIVVPVDRARVFCVQKATIQEDGSFTVDDLTGVPNAVQVIRDIKSTQDLWDLLAEWNKRFGHAAQGIVVHYLPSGSRYKIRTPEYNRVRALRGNSARRDFLWLDLWRSGKLLDYLRLYPEERAAAESMVSRWKQITNDVFHIYTDVFKARSLAKAAIPPKYRPLVYGLHTLYMESLKPAGRSVDWKAALQYMNERDTAQMLFVINWEVRAVAKQLGVPSIPLEPASSVETAVSGETAAEAKPKTGTWAAKAAAPAAAAAPVAAAAGGAGASQAEGGEEAMSHSEWYEEQVQLFKMDRHMDMDSL